MALCNPGRTAAMKVAKLAPGCDVLWPVFTRATRAPKDTDFNDLHARQGLDAVARQLVAVLLGSRRNFMVEEAEHPPQPPASGSVPDAEALVESPSPDTAAPVEGAGGEPVANVVSLADAKARKPRKAP